MRDHLLLLLSLLLLSFGFLGCSKSFHPDIQRGSDYNYKEGYPEVRFSAIGLIDEDSTPKINIAADIVYGSLIYNQEGDQYKASLAIDVQIIDQGKNGNTVKSERFTMDIEKEDPNIVYSQQTFSIEKSFEVPPGDYKINLSLTDLNSDKRITSSTQTYIPDPEKSVLNLTNIRMSGKNMADATPQWKPITTYTVPGRVDSLKFIFQVTNNDSEDPLVVDSRLLRFDSDTSVARPMHYNNYSPSSIQYKGIDYDEEEVIQSTQRRLQQPGNVLIEFTFPQQERGNYRFEVETNKSNSESENQYKARDFGIKSANYPAVKTAEELARPLVYLMDDGEYEDLMKINNSDSLKAAVDRFWLRNVGNKQKARSVIEKYYQRVEEANKQFSNYKEGWKTDTGMIYVLFGPPWYVDRSLDEMQWSYSYNREDPERNFYFYQPKFKSKFYPFQHFIFRRSQNYFSVQYQQVELWLSGLILQRSI